MTSPLPKVSKSQSATKEHTKFHSSSASSDNLDVNLLFLVIVLLVHVGEGQNAATDVKVGIVNDVGTAYSNMTLLCINMSLSEFYSSHPETRTRLVTTLVDSQNDVVIAAAAGTHNSYLHYAVSSKVFFFA